MKAKYATTYSSNVVNHLNYLSSTMFPPDIFNKFYSVYKEESKKQLKDDEGHTVSPSASNIAYRSWDRFKSEINGGPDDKLSAAYISVFEWILNKVVYSFDEDVEKGIVETKWSDVEKTPVNIFDRLPLDAFGVALRYPLKLTSTSGQTASYDTVCCFNDCVYLDGVRRTLGLLFCLFSTGTQISRPVAFMFVPDDSWSEDILRDIDNMSIKDVYENIRIKEYDGDPDGTYRSVIRYVISYVLYLCSQNAEVEQIDKEVYRPYTVEPKHKYREVKQYMCGRETGMRIRDFKKRQSVCHVGGVGSVKAPHVRRAHYHTYYVGRGDKKHAEVRWMPPIYIHKELREYIRPVNAKLKKEYS